MPPLPGPLDPVGEVVDDAITDLIDQVPPPPVDAPLPSEPVSPASTPAPGTAVTEEPLGVLPTEPLADTTGDATDLLTD